MSDSHLDPLLRGVPLPDGLLDRLRQIAREAPSRLSDDQLDAWLCRVEIPAGLTTRLLRQRPPLRRRPALRRLALAASILLAVGLTYTSALAALLSSRYQLSPTTAELEAQAADDQTVVTLDAAWVLADSAETLPHVLDSAAHLELVPPSPGPEISPPALTSAELPEPPAADIDVAFPPLPAGTPLLEVASRFPREAFGAVAIGALRPDALRRPAGRGVEPPSVAAYPLQMQLLTGIHPAVSPSADPQLQTSRIPLTSDTTSFESARRSLAVGEHPVPATVRVEDFLAAVDYGLPRPTGQPLALHVAGGPSPFGQRDLGLLQLAVQAASVADSPRPATHLTLAIDASAGMRDANRLDIVRRAVESLAARMTAEDRLSLVIFRRQAETLIEFASREQIALVRDLLAAVEPRSETDIVAGLRAAYALAEAGPLEPIQLDATDNPAARKVVLISDGGMALEANVSRRVDQALSAAAESGVDLAVIDLSGQELPDTQLAGFARAAGGRLHRAAYARHAEWALVEALTNVRQTVAADASLSIEFDPRTVAAYRLLGHEASNADGWVSAALTTEMRADQTATGLYELRLLPGPADTVGVARLRWRDPATGAVREEHRTIRRADFAATIAEAPVSLQMAAVAAETAEQLRQSYFAQFSSPRDIADLARALGPRFIEFPTVRPFLEMSFQSLQARPPGAARAAEGEQTAPRR